MKDLSALFAAELAKKTIEKDPNEDGDGNAGSVISRFAGKTLGFVNTLAKKPKPEPPILQLCAVPFAIDISQYKNPHTSDNPTGDYKAAYRLSRLADPIPEMSASYSPSLNSTEKIWGNIINAAATKSAYTQNLLTSAQFTYGTSKMYGTGGIPEDWYPVYTIPSNWYDIVEDKANLIEMEIDTINGDTKNDDFLLLNGGKAISLNVIANNNNTQVSFSTNTVIKKIKLKVLRIDFVRPWLNFEILNLSNWEIDGLEKEYYSNGKLKDNDGVFPLITRSMLIGTNISIEGNFDKKDLDMIAGAGISSSNVSLGPFIVNNGGEAPSISNVNGKTVITSTVKQVIGFISQVVPETPN